MAYTHKQRVLEQVLTLKTVDESNLYMSNRGHSVNMLTATVSGETAASERKSGVGQDLNQINTRNNTELSISNTLPDQNQIGLHASVHASARNAE